MHNFIILIKKISSELEQNIYICMYINNIFIVYDKG